MISVNHTYKNFVILNYPKTHSRRAGAATSLTLLSGGQFEHTVAGARKDLQQLRS
jgi:hypothetical protein